MSQVRRTFAPEARLCGDVVRQLVDLELGAPASGAASSIEGAVGDVLPRSQLERWAEETSRRCLELLRRDPERFRLLVDLDA